LHIVSRANCFSTASQDPGKGSGAAVSTYLNPKGTAIQLNDAEDDLALKKMSSFKPDATTPGANPTNSEFITTTSAL
jgi:hypothetical protein